MINKLEMCLLCVLLLAACTNNQGSALEPTATPSPTKAFNPYEISDGGFISGEPCGPPCFLGITPGISSSYDIKTILGDYGLLSECEEGGWGWICPGLPLSLRIHIVDDDVSKVSSIIFSTTDIQLGSLIDAYGDPDRWTDYLPNDDSGYPMSYYYLELCFDEINTVTRLEKTNINEPCLVQPTTPVIEVTYFDGTCTSYYEFSRIWSGYGEYKIDSP